MPLILNHSARRVRYRLWVYILTPEDAAFPIGAREHDALVCLRI
jgi:hypothetical protein